MAAFSKLGPDGDPTKAGVKGAVRLAQAPGGKTRIVAEITGLSPGRHAFRIHESGDVSGGCAGAGAIYNPKAAGKKQEAEDKKKAEAGDKAEARVGDLGNVVAGADGAATLDIEAPLVQLSGAQTVIGKSFVVHADADEPAEAGKEKSDAAGARLACGVIKKAVEKPKANSD